MLWMVTRRLPSVLAHQINIHRGACEKCTSHYTTRRSWTYHNEDQGALLGAKAQTTCKVDCVKLLWLQAIPYNGTQGTSTSYAANRTNSWRTTLPGNRLGLRRASILEEKREGDG